MFARELLHQLGEELKEKARQKTFADGRNTITEEDMRQAAAELLGPENVEIDDSSVDNA